MVPVCNATAMPTVSLHPVRRKKSREGKIRALYNWKITKPNFLINLSSSSPLWLLHIIFIMILSMETQRGSIYLCTFLSTWIESMWLGLMIVSVRIKIKLIDWIPMFGIKSQHFLYMFVVTFRGHCGILQ